MAFLTIEQMAEELGVRPSWIYSRTGDGTLRGTGRGRKPRRRGASTPRPEPAPAPQERIPHYKAGRLLRFDRDEVFAWWAKFHRNGAKPSGQQPEGDPQPAVITPVN